MNCPNCGAETNGSVCPVCGAEVGTSGGFTLAGNDQPQQPEMQHMVRNHSREWGWIHSMVDHSIREIQCRMVMQEMHMVRRDLILAQVISSHQKRRNPVQEQLLESLLHLQ